jgi:hypothetical protein
VVTEPAGVEVFAAAGQSEWLFRLKEGSGEILMGDWDCQGAMLPAVVTDHFAYYYRVWPAGNEESKPVARASISDGGEPVVGSDPQPPSGLDWLQGTPDWTRWCASVSPESAN